MAIRDGIDLAHIATHGIDAFEAFSKSKFALWENSVNNSKIMIKNMHISERSHL